MVCQVLIIESLVFKFLVEIFHSFEKLFLFIVFSRIIQSILPE